MFSGSFVALVTPFNKSNQVNLEKIKELVQYHMQHGTNGFVPCGTTGESPTLTTQEKLNIFKTVVEEVDGRFPVIAGTGNYNTLETIELTKKARDLGATAALVITPYYNKPTQEGLYRHFRSIADETDFPLVVYNVPSRTSVNILPETIKRLADHPRIVAVKEASGNLAQISEIHRLCGNKISLLSGDDGLTLPLLSVGGDGVISVSANILPRELHDIVALYLNGDVNGALEMHEKLALIHRVLFIETNPLPIKTAMNLMGWEMGGFRAPLCEMAPENVEILENELHTAGLLK